MESLSQENSVKESAAGDQFEPMIEAWRTQLDQECNAAINRLKIDLMRKYSETRHRETESSGNRETPQS